MVEPYAAGTLADPEALEFERHLVGCAECQAAVRFAVAVREGVRTMPPKQRRVSRPFATVVLGGLAAAAGLAFLMVQSGDGDQLRALGAVSQAPSYQGIEVRAPARADSLFDEAMRLYTAGRHEDAGSALRVARTVGADSVPTSFFIGLVELLSGRPRAAVDEMRIVIQRGPSPYQAEAHLYLAKAWLQLRRADSAAVHLTAAANMPSTVSAHARALSDSVAEARR